MSAEVAAQLRQAKSLIATPETWLQGEASRFDGDTFQMCALTATVRATNGGGAFNPAAEALRAIINNESIADWNDSVSTEHADVMAAFDAAIRAEMGDRP